MTSTLSTTKGLQRSSKVDAPGLMNFVPALASNCSIHATWSTDLRRSLEGRFRKSGCYMRNTPPSPSSGVPLRTCGRRATWRPPTGSRTTRCREEHTKSRNLCAEDAELMLWELREFRFSLILYLSTRWNGVYFLGLRFGVIMISSWINYRWFGALLQGLSVKCINSFRKPDRRLNEVLTILSMKG